MKPFRIFTAKQDLQVVKFLATMLTCLLLLIIEIIFLTLKFDTGSKAILATPYALYGGLYFAGKVLRIAIVSFGALGIFSVLRITNILAIVRKHPTKPNYSRYLVLHLFAITGLYYLSQFLFITIPKTPNFSDLLVYSSAFAWLLTGMLSIFCLLRLIGDNAFWRELLSQEKNTLLAAIITGLLAQSAAYLSTTIWKSLAFWTFISAKHLLDLLYPDVMTNPLKFAIGVNHFSVNIAPQCSGYEGMGLIIAFLILYLWLFRQQLRFPHVLILFPLGIISMWLLNVVRIVFLIIIGDKLSPEIAVSGFHSSAGWILFVGLSVLLIFASQKVAFFNASANKPAISTKTLDNTNKALSLLVPFVVLMASILLTNALSGNFDWLYPIKVIASISVIWLYRQYYRTYSIELTRYPIMIGIVVFCIWLALVPVSIDNDTKFAQTLFLQSPTIIAGWIIFRLIGACLTVPIIEELAFRGYVLAKLINKDITQVAAGSFTWLSFLVSSLLFGVLHGDWLPGLLAGMGFAYALYRRGQLFDAVLAHMVTNLLLSIYVIYTGHWSLW